MPPRSSIVGHRYLRTRAGAAGHSSPRTRDGDVIRFKQHVLAQEQSSPRTHAVSDYASSRTRVGAGERHAEHMRAQVMRLAEYVRTHGMRLSEHVLAQVMRL